MTFTKAELWAYLCAANKDEQPWNEQVAAVKGQTLWCVNKRKDQRLV